MKQATQQWRNETLRRWAVTTDRGIKIVWSADREGARVKVRRHGLKVLEIKPAPSLIEQQK